MAYDSMKLPTFPPILSGPFWDVVAYENRMQGSVLSIACPDISTFCREFIASNF